MIQTCNEFRSEPWISMPSVERRIAGALAASIVAPYSMALQLWVWNMVRFNSGDPYEYLTWVNLDQKAPATFNAFQALFEALAVATYGLIYISPPLFLVSCLIAWQTESFKWAVLTGMLLGGGIAMFFLIAEPSLILSILTIQATLSGAFCGWTYGIVVFRNRRPLQARS